MPDGVPAGVASALRASGFLKGQPMADRAPIALDLTEAIIASSTEPLVLLDGDLAIIAASNSFFSAFQIARGDALGRKLGAIGRGEWDIPQLGGLLEATASGNADIDAYEIDLIRVGQSTRRLVVNVHKLSYDDPDNTRLLMSVSDVTDARLDAIVKDDLLREKGVMLQELQHRVANSLQIIASVIMQSARKAKSDETRGQLYNAHHRVMSVATVQQQLAVSTLGEVALAPYFTALCRSIGASMISDPEQLSIEVTVDDSMTAADISVSLGLIVTELVINALKHAFPANMHGTIRVGYQTKGLIWKLTVRDNGIGMPLEPQTIRIGLGTTIVEALARKLGASVVNTPGNPGTLVTITNEEMLGYR
jgi:two-component sensor histidine kinase